MAVWLNLIPQLHQPGGDDISMRHHHFHEKDPHYYAGKLKLYASIQSDLINLNILLSTKYISMVNLKDERRSSLGRFFAHSVA